MLSIRCFDVHLRRKRRFMATLFGSFVESFSYCLAILKASADKLKLLCPIGLTLLNDLKPVNSYRLPSSALHRSTSVSRLL